MLDRWRLSAFQLADEDIALLTALEQTMQYYADLLGADIFLGCFTPGKETSVVVAEAKPQFSLSNYSASVLGQVALPQNEPALFAALRVQMPVWDTIAVTQEHKTVRQDVVPLKKADGSVFGTLISERDVSEDVRQRQKYEELVKVLSKSGAAAEGTAAGLLELREMHHRVKNNLQMVASILNIQSRRSKQPETREILQENVNRILSIASVYDMLLHEEGSDLIPLKPLLKQVVDNIEASITGGETHIAFTLTGAEIRLSAERATLVAVVVNELVTNCVKHAFVGRRKGNVAVALERGSSCSLVLVEDDGIGYQPEKKAGFGIELVRLTVEERLKGSIHVASGSGGTRFSFDFLTE